MADKIKTLTSAKLTSVEFVHDYIQLRFDGPYLIINAPVAVFTKENHFQQGDAGFRDALCDRIEQHVQRASTTPDEHLVIEFEDDTRLEVSLKTEDQKSAEAAVLSDDSGQICVW